MKAFTTVVMRLLREVSERLRASGAQVFLAGDDGAAKAVAAALATDIGLGVGSRRAGRGVAGGGAGRRIPKVHGDKPGGVAPIAGVR